MKKQNVGGEDFQKFFDEGKIIVNTESLGEEAIITPKSKIIKHNTRKPKRPKSKKILRKSLCGCEIV